MTGSLVNGPSCIVCGFFYVLGIVFFSSIRTFVPIYYSLPFLLLHMECTRCLIHTFVLTFIMLDLLKIVISTLKHLRFANVRGVGGRVPGVLSAVCPTPIGKPGLVVVRGRGRIGNVHESRLGVAVEAEVAHQCWKGGT